MAGHAGEWAETAGWLTERCRVVALDARGHGRSERLAPDVSPGAHVADAVFAVEHDVEVMVRTLREAASRSHWDDWERISCPSLVVRAGNGPIPPGDAQAMAARGQRARLVELAGAEHDLHLDRPAEWRQVLSEFVSALGTAAA